MTFLDAIRTKRPMRRRKDGWLTGPWIRQKVLSRDTKPSPDFAEPWVRMDKGTQLTLSCEDYTASDWEVQP